MHCCILNFSGRLAFSRAVGLATVYTYIPDYQFVKHAFREFVTIAEHF